uniref:Uncharacterized protein n=1 Tax=Arundo donax TaxID=35708 RepID=A0A0A9EEZ5_ARUDO
MKISMFAFIKRLKCCNNNDIKITVYMHTTKQWCKGVGSITTTTHR